LECSTRDTDARTVLLRRVKKVKKKNRIVVRRRRAYSRVSRETRYFFFTGLECRFSREHIFAFEYRDIFPISGRSRSVLLPRSLVPGALCWRLFNRIRISCGKFNGYRRARTTLPNWKTRTHANVLQEQKKLLARRTFTFSTFTVCESVFFSQCENNNILPVAI